MIALSNTFLVPETDGYQKNSALAVSEKIGHSAFNGNWRAIFNLLL
jgi:hypothetical protein